MCNGGTGGLINLVTISSFVVYAGSDCGAGSKELSGEVKFVKWFSSGKTIYVGPEVNISHARVGR